ncbi:MAG: hypothetical protein EHM91_00075 [Planctomycetota bacterium]|nr:MAG: hypothetical protein EHM91_00075 [Planctomycetota bacterium]
MSNATNYLENHWIDHQFRSAPYAKPTAAWVALYTAAPSDPGGGTEVTGGGYARVNLPPLDTNWTATQGGVAGASSGTSGTTTNAVIVTFPVPSADWGTVTAVAIYDAPTGGNPLVWAPLTTPRDIKAGDPAPRFQPGTLAIAVA